VRAIAPIPLILWLARPRVTESRDAPSGFNCDLSCVAGVGLLCHLTGIERAANFG
jgi:hypothetical protein